MGDLFENRRARHRRETEATWEIKDTSGRVIALHDRRDLPGGKKKMRWSQPDNPVGLAGLKVKDLPCTAASYWLPGQASLCSWWRESRPAMLWTT